MIDELGIPTSEIAAFHGISVEELKQWRAPTSSKKTKVTKKTLEGLRKGMLRFEEELGGGKGKPGKADKKSAERKKVQTLPEVAKRSVSLDFLLRFTEANDCWGWTTVEVVEKIIKPATAKFECAYCELPAYGVQAIYENEVGPPRLFMSHAWENSWGALVIGVQKLAEHHQEIPLLTCWIDCFAINQHGAQERLKELESTVAVSSNFMIIGDPPAVFTRAWCLYEVVTWLFSGKKKISLCAGTLDEASRTFITAEPAAVAAAVDGINLASAKASVARDSDEIFKLVRERIPGGMEAVNETVKGALMTEALSTKEAPLVDEFDAGSLVKGVRSYGKHVEAGAFNGWGAGNGAHDKDVLLLDDVLTSGEVAAAPSAAPPPPIASKAPVASLRGGKPPLSSRGGAARTVRKPLGR
uniref:Uncharacterized protein n=1 Tax=Haptolina ericina TaxID=156174 RepID=A0A7S3BLX9_9EUKA